MTACPAPAARRPSTAVLALALGMALGLSLAPPSMARCPPREDEAQTPWRQLTWDDFRKRMSGRSSSAAYTTTAIVLGKMEVTSEKEGEVWAARPGRLCIYAEMDKLQSGVAADAKTRGNLARAQTRFDVTEVFARRFYQQAKDLEGLGPLPNAAERELRAQIRRLYGEIRTRLRETLKRFDEETDFSRKRRPQKKWEKTVAQWLEEVPPIPR